ncbi:uncharacterized protein LOC141905891 [Tubulanus polymorphus]|uniref:uncharacterized protein LOC141905891 n=1 Tax=Tubulanus polymorphus TaxID=672921 RepID=UPI003DA271A6
MILEAKKMERMNLTHTTATTTTTTTLIDNTSLNTTLTDILNRTVECPAVNKTIVNCSDSRETSYLSGSWISLDWAIGITVIASIELMIIILMYDKILRDSHRQQTDLRDSSKTKRTRFAPSSVFFRPNSGGDDSVNLFADRNAESGFPSDRQAASSSIDAASDFSQRRWNSERQHFSNRRSMSEMNLAQMGSRNKTRLAPPPPLPPSQIRAQGYCMGQAGTSNTLPCNFTSAALEPRETSYINLDDMEIESSIPPDLPSISDIEGEFRVHYERPSLQYSMYTSDEPYIPTPPPPTWKPQPPPTTSEI